VTFPDTDLKSKKKNENFFYAWKEIPVTMAGSAMEITADDSRRACRGEWWKI